MNDLHLSRARWGFLPGTRTSITFAIGVSGQAVPLMGDAAEAGEGDIRGVDAHSIAVDVREHVIHVDLWGYSPRLNNLPYQID